MTIFKEPLLRHDFVVTAAAEKHLEPVAIKTDGVGSQALDINATLNKISPTIAGVWDLTTTSQKAPEPGNTLFVAHKNPSAESVISGDDRRLVDPVHFATGGKYRSILKLFIKYENLGDNQFAHGTGWLIRPDVMITAGHNVYSWKINAGRAREIVAYAGYNGNSSTGSPAVQMCKAKRVVTTSQWLANRGSMAHDFALVQFEKPFDNATPFQYIETPPEGDLVLGVVGYPADKIDERTGEKGGRMYELFEKTKYNIKEQKDTMLEHYIDSEGGNSGGPVLRGSDLTAIAIHVYGGDTNTASTLGRYGNPVQDYIAALNMPLPDPNNINLVTIGSSLISQINAATGLQAKEIDRLGENIIDSEPVGREGFYLFNDLDEILKITSGVAEVLGSSLTSSIGTVTTPTIIWALKSAQADGGITDTNICAGIHRAVLANSALIVEVLKQLREEALFPTLMNIVEVADVFGKGSAHFSYDKVMHKIGVHERLAKELIDFVSGEVTRGLTIQALPKILESVMNKPGDSMDYHQPLPGNRAGDVAAGTTQEINVPSIESFATKLGDALMQLDRQESTLDANAAKLSSEADPANPSRPSLTQELIKAAASGGKEETVQDDCMITLEQVVEGQENNSSTEVTFCPPKASVEGTCSPVSDAEKLVKDSKLNNRDPLSKFFFDGSTEVEITPSLGRTSVHSFRHSSTAYMLDLARKATGSKRAEITSNSPQAMFEELRTEISKISQALILRHILADRFLTAQMNRPASELKEEGFFTNVGGLIRDVSKVAILHRSNRNADAVVNEILAHGEHANNSMAADLLATLLGIVYSGTNKPENMPGFGFGA